jgi:hypothetical protein
MPGLREAEGETRSHRSRAGHDRDVHGAQTIRALGSAAMLAATDWGISVIELAVGAGCLVVAVGLLRRAMRLIALVLIVAGLAAVIHAHVALAS